MANSSKAVRVGNSRYRTIPNFSNYGVSAMGEVINLNTRQVLNVKDLNHWSGRVNLYNSKIGRRTFSIMNLIRMTYSKAWADRVETQFSPQYA